MNVSASTSSIPPQERWWKRPIANFSFEKPRLGGLLGSSWTAMDRGPATLRRIQRVEGGFQQAESAARALVSGEGAGTSAAIMRDAEQGHFYIGMVVGPHTGETTQTSVGFPPVPSAALSWNNYPIDGDDLPYRDVRVVPASSELQAVVGKNRTIDLREPR